MNGRNLGFLIEFFFYGKLGCTECWTWGNGWVWNNLFCLKFVYQYFPLFNSHNSHWNNFFSKSPWMFDVVCWCFQLAHKAISYIIQLMSQHLVCSCRRIKEARAFTNAKPIYIYIEIVGKVCCFKERWMCSVFGAIMNQMHLTYSRAITVNTHFSITPWNVT